MSTAKSYFCEIARRGNKFNGLTNEEIARKTIDIIPAKKFFAEVNKINAANQYNVDASALYKIGKGILISELDDIFKEYPRLHKKQVIRLFEKMAAAKKETDVASNNIMATMLVDLIETLSSYTQKELDYAYIQRAVNSGSVITVEDIADFFSARDGRKIAQILAKISRPQLSRETVKSFIADSCGLKADELDEEKTITSLTPATRAGEDDYFVVVFWAEAEFNKVVNNNFVKNKTIGDLINYLAQ